ncbi:hypothetical protein JCM33774_88840 [Actinophytocola sp. KF-1]
MHNTKNPTSLARMVMSGPGVPYTTQDYFFTQRRWDALIDAKENATVDSGGTVGAVAVDRGRGSPPPPPPVGSPTNSSAGSGTRRS